MRAKNAEFVAFLFFLLCLCLYMCVCVCIVRLNLFNHVLALFRAKFACNLEIRYPIFRWDLLKGCVSKNVKKTQDVCNQRSLATGSRD